MKAQTTLLNLLYLYLAAGRVMGANPRAQPPKYEPFDAAESDSSVDEEEEDDVLGDQIGRLPSALESNQGSEQYPDPAAPPPEDSLGSFLSGIFGSLSSSKSSIRPPRPATTIGAGWGSSPYTYGQGVQQQGPASPASPQPWGSPLPGYVQQPWGQPPDVPPVPSNAAEVVTVTVTQNVYTVITVTQPAVTSISILLATTVTATVTADAVTLTAGGAGAAPTVTYDQVTVTQFYTYPQQTVTVTESAGAFAPVTVTHTVIAPPVVTYTAPAPPAITYTAPASTVTVTVTANSLAAATPRPSPNTLPQVRSTAAPSAATTSRVSFSPTPAYSSSATNLATRATPASSALSSISTWYCRTRCDGSWGPGKTADVQAPHKPQATQQSNSQLGGYNALSYGPSAWRGINMTATMSTVVVPEANAKVTELSGAIPDRLYAASHQRVPTLSRNREIQSTAVPSPKTPTSGVVAPEQSVVIVEAPASIEGSDLPAEPPSGAGRMDPSVNQNVDREKKVASSNSGKKLDLSPWGPPPQWGNSAQQQSPWQQQAPRNSMQPWGLQPVQQSSYSPQPAQGQYGPAPIDPWSQEPDIDMDPDEDSCTDGLDGRRAASGMCRAKQQEEQERRAREQQQEEAEKRAQQQKQGQKPQPRTGQPQQQPKQQPQQQGGGTTWWNPLTFLGGRGGRGKTNVSNNFYSKRRSRVY